LPRWTTLSGATLLLAAAGMWAAARRGAAMDRDTAAAARAAAAAELDVRTKDIAFYERRAATDPQGAGDRAQLAVLHLQRSRETADFQDVLRAESEARASLARRTQRNSTAYVALASSLVAQHRFAEARDVARRLVADEPGQDAYRAMLGETCLELGDYDGARAAFDAITLRGRASPSTAPQLARWAEIRGDTARARLLLRRARSLAEADGALPREQRAWFALRVADLDLRQGRANDAGRELREGLTVSPDDHRLLAAMARLAAVRHDWRAAIDYGERSIATALDPATLGVVSDAYAALGDGARAAEYARVMQVAVSQQPGAYHRAWSLFLLDHGRDVAAVRAAAEAELATRRDVYGYDVVAWARYKQGRVDEARQAMAAALAQGTQDALLLYHAGMIERAAGNLSAARTYLRRGLAVSPYFDVSGPAAARATLDSLGG
jgi:tetratricopeptide (TPR) repeat protein